MYFIASFGMLLMVLSSVMIISPTRWSRSIILFSEQTYFHWFEVISRLVAGLLFVFYSKQVPYSTAFLYFGYLMVVVAIGLVFVGPAKHIQFAKWSAVKFRKRFRIAGIFSLLLSIFIIYLCLG